MHNVNYVTVDVSFIVLAEAEEKKRVEDPWKNALINSIIARTDNSTWYEYLMGVVEKREIFKFPTFWVLLRPKDGFCEWMTTFTLKG